MSTVLIVAAHGYGNVGDDICAHSGAYLVSQADPKLKTIITSPPYNPLVVRKADAVILSGGGIIYDRAKDNVNNYLRYLEYGQKRGLPTAVIGIGVQGIVTDWGKQRYKEALNKTQLITTRSQQDKPMLDEIGVKNVIATQDLGLLADEWIKEPVMKPKLKKTDKPRLGLILLDPHFLQAYKAGNRKLRRYVQVVDSNLKHLVKEFDIHLFAHSKDDDPWREEMTKRYDLPVVPYKNSSDLPRFWQMYQQMNLILGVRFHSVILGLLAGKPTIGIGSSGAKLSRLAAEAPTLDQQCYEMGNSRQVKHIFKHLRRMYEAEKFKVLPAAELAALKAKARQNLELLKPVLKSLRDEPRAWRLDGVGDHQTSKQP